jgi:signal transduction histidine kinase
VSAVSRNTQTAAEASRTSLSSQLLHDLRNALNQIIGYSEVLLEEADGLRPEAVTDLHHVRDAGRRMLALIEANFTVSSEKKTFVNRTVTIDRRSAPDAGVIRQERSTAPGLVLVVDDDATNRDVLSRRLERQGHRVVTACCGRDALELMHESEFDIALLDIMMPDMDGYELLGRIKGDAALRHVPVIMISAIDEVQSVVRCIEAGADDYLAKPFDPILLKARIGSSLEKKRGRDREAVLYGQLQQNYERLQQLEQLRDDMRNMIVHDLRTPLTAVMVGVELLGKHGTLTPTQNQLVTIATTGGKTLLGMINDLLDVEKMESGTLQLHRTSLSASVLVAAAVEQVSSLAEMERTTLVTEVAADLADFDADENLLVRTLVNLLANAIKFTHDGTVSISASQVVPETMRFAIRDTGKGIPADAFERIFEKFGQLDSGPRVGTGLGLAFCKLAVETHGGEIHVESTPGVGSTFSFTIPTVPR